MHFLLEFANQALFIVKQHTVSSNMLTLYSSEQYSCLKAYMHHAINCRKSSENFSEDWVTNEIQNIINFKQNICQIYSGTAAQQ